MWKGCTWSDFATERVYNSEMAHWPSIDKTYKCQIERSGPKTQSYLVTSLPSQAIFDSLRSTQ